MNSNQVSWWQAGAGGLLTGLGDYLGGQGSMNQQTPTAGNPANPAASPTQANGAVPNAGGTNITKDVMIVGGIVGALALVYFVVKKK